jgi:hypothetical protein
MLELRPASAGSVTPIPGVTPIWKPEAALKWRSCKRGRYSPPMHLMKLTETREITRSAWVRPDEMSQPAHAGGLSPIQGFL